MHFRDGHPDRLGKWGVGLGVAAGGGALIAIAIGIAWLVGSNFHDGYRLVSATPSGHLTTFAR